MNYNEQLLAFIEKSPSMFHAIQEMKDTFVSHGYIYLSEHETWKLEAGKHYVVTRNGSSLIAFQMPETSDYHYQIVASHSDSPCFQLKPNPEMKSGMFVKLNVEPYGGLIANSWYDRPLSVAGRIIVNENGKVETRYVNVDEDLLVIPNLAIHMNREVNNGVKVAMQNDVMPLYAMSEHQDILETVAKYANVSKEAIISHELYVYNRQKGTLFGDEKAFIASPKLDNLQSAFASMSALLDANNPNSVNMVCCFDNEEIGSSTRQGADSKFLSSVMERIDASFGKSVEERYAILASSFLVSCDNAHSYHPNYGGKADPSNQIFMNQGVVMKHSARKAYTSDGLSSAAFMEVCRKADVPVQHFVNHNEIPGGGTLGAISSSHVSIVSVDIGLAQLAMHSAYETGGALDSAYMIRALSYFYNHDVIVHQDEIEVK